MKFFFKILLFLLPISTIAQDSVVTITPSMFDKASDQFYIADGNGWIFKQGNDTNWAKPDIDITGWKKLKPANLTAKYADKTGRVECWFRIKIKLDDSTSGNQPMGIKLSSWAATDLYIDGNLVLTTGNTGSNGKPFKEYSPFGNPSFPADFRAGKIYTIALHFVDYVSPVPQSRLKSEETGPYSIIRITGSKYNALFIKIAKTRTIYNTIGILVSAILSMLFWLLFIQNPFEKNLRLIAFASMFLALAMFCISSEDNIGMSHNAYLLYNYGFFLFLLLTCLITPLILVNIFKRRVTSALKVFLFIFFISWIISLFVPGNLGAKIGIILMAALLAVCIYYIFSSWKKLKGAQWAVVAGLLFSIACFLGYIFLAIFFHIQSAFLFNLVLACFFLGFPLSLLVYVSIRFKEIIKEVHQNAEQVVQLSEEKKQQALNQQKLLQEEVKRQTEEIRTALNNLKSTQSQLVQSEKMASLGELTAGIAHEIQNPLNFVNNFSEVNKELLLEMKDEIDKGNINEVKSIADDLISNQEKINHHGKRADAIVKGMMQHSKANSGQRELTDINALADEYLRLSYHGLRAKDKSFNATLQTAFDRDLSSVEGKINIIPQDIGRVLLNLYNNAFYACAERLRQAQPASNYEPKVSVKTKKTENSVLVTVSDNGNGIPQNIIDKIFQPFFTTKPTGQGTGLGLSLSYDIVKAHGGEIKVETNENDGTTFSIKLPIFK